MFTCGSSILLAKGILFTNPLPNVSMPLPKILSLLPVISLIVGSTTLASLPETDGIN